MNATLAHLSDLHFGRIDPRVATALLDDLNTRPPSLVVVSGDLTQHGRRREFEAASAFLSALECPVFVVPGNHDIPFRHLPLRFLDPMRRFREALRSPIEPRLVLDGTIALCGLNTARPWALELDWSHGTLDRVQIARASTFLAQAPKAVLRVVVAHHPFATPPGEERRRRVRRADEALTAFAEAEADVILTGHLHRRFATLVRVAAGERHAARRLLVMQASTATSERRRDDDNGYHRLAWDPLTETLAVETHRWQGTGFQAEPRVTYQRRHDGLE